MTAEFIKSGLITPEALHTLISAGNVSIRVMDASYVLPGQPAPKPAYEAAHIPGAGFFDIDAVSDKASPLPHMLPAPGEFAQAVSQLGISNSDLVILYGQQSPAMGPARAWWMFRVFGHDRVCVLDGGLKGWIDAGYETEAGVPAAPPAASFTPSYRPELVLSLQDMRAASDSGDVSILDARPMARFEGQEPEPRPGLKRGHIPGSACLPAGALLDEAGRLKGRAVLESLFREAGVAPGKSFFATCGSGVTACLLALAAHYLGYRDVPVYDGAWAEWGAEGSPLPAKSHRA